MITIIAGSRTIKSLSTLVEALETCPWKPTTVISGGAKGVDFLGECYAKENNIALQVINADWSLGKSAGYKRNEKMAECAEALVALWDGKSRGTKHMIDIAKRKGIAVYIKEIENMQQNAKVISVEIDISIPKQDGSGSYKGSRLVYTDDSGKIQTQAFHENTFKFNMALKQQLKELKTGDQVVIDKEKPEGSSFWKVNGILKQTGVVSGQSSNGTSAAHTPSQPSPKSTYETPEERAKKQVYIVRQSSISAAIALNPKAKVVEVLDVAKQFEDYVFGHNVKPVAEDNFPGDEGEVF